MWGKYHVTCVKLRRSISNTEKSGSHKERFVFSRDLNSFCKIISLYLNEGGKIMSFSVSELSLF